MKAKCLFAYSLFIIFSTLNCMLAVKVADSGHVIDYAGHYDESISRLDLSNLGITEEILDDESFDLLCFINSKKVEAVSLEGNQFVECNFMFLKKISNFLMNSTTLKSISLKNNFGHSSSKRAIALSPEALSQITAAIGNVASLFTDSLNTANKQTTTEYITKEILLDDMPPLSIIKEIKLPLTGCQKLKAFAVNFSIGLASLLVSTGGTVLTLYLTGKFECDCPAPN